jgi:hypothetical protein
MAIYCDVRGCGTAVSEGCGSRSGRVLCKRCASAYAYWRRQGRAALDHRREQLEFLAHRSDYLTAHVGKLVKAARQRASEATRRAREART